MWHSLLSKIRDDGDGETDDGEYSANVGHPSEGKAITIRRWRVGIDVLQQIVRSVRYKYFSIRTSTQHSCRGGLYRTDHILLMLAAAFKYATQIAQPVM